MQRTLLGAAGAVTLALVLAACGDSGDSSTATDGKAGGKDCTPASSTLTVGGLDKLTFDADAYEADAGCLEVTFKNEGSVAHTLLIKGQKGFKLAVGDIDKGTIDLAAGDYEIYCDVAGHEAAGMVADLMLK